MAEKSLPGSVIIIGAGVFGLSTALAIAKSHPTTKVTIIDRYVPPVEDGTSVDTTRCIRAGIFPKPQTQSSKLKSTINSR